MSKNWVDNLPNNIESSDHSFCKKYSYVSGVYNVLIENHNPLIKILFRLLIPHGNFIVGQWLLLRCRQKNIPLFVSHNLNYNV